MPPADDCRAREEMDLFREEVDVLRAMVSDLRRESSAYAAGLRDAARAVRTRAGREGGYARLVLGSVADTVEALATQAEGG